MSKLRHRLFPHTYALKSLDDEHDMGVCTEMSHANVAFTCMCNHNGASSKIDHIIVSNSVSECEIAPNPHSDHEVVY